MIWTPSSDVEGGRRRLLRVGGGRRLAQFLTKTYSYPTEVNDFFSRLAPVGGGEEEEERDVRENGGNKYGLVGDGVGDERVGTTPPPTRTPPLPIRDLPTRRDATAT